MDNDRVRQILIDARADFLANPEKLEKYLIAMKSETKRRKTSQGMREFHRDPEKHERFVQSPGMQRSANALRAYERGLDFTKKRIEALALQMKPSNLERWVAMELDELGIVYEQQRVFWRYIVDFFIPDRNLVIECDGVYWHRTPEQLAHDRKRDAWLTEKCNLRIVRLSEAEIRESPSTSVQRALG
jgi:very-short-patch-repair endonuclease